MCDECTWHTQNRRSTIISTLGRNVALYCIPKQHPARPLHGRSVGRPVVVVVVVVVVDSRMCDECTWHQKLNQNKKIVGELY